MAAKPNHWDDARARRADRLREIREQIKDGSLVIRKMTAAERAANPVKDPQAAKERAAKRKAAEKRDADRRASLKRAQRRGAAARSK